MTTYARLLHDFQWMSYKSRTVTPGWPGLPSTPETVPFFKAPKGGKDDVPLDDKWRAYLKELNSARGYKFIISPPAGWFNRNQMADSLGFGGNVVEIVEIANGAAKIKRFHYKDNPPPADSWNYEEHPELIHKFTVISPTGQVVNPANDIDVYVFVIGRGDLYVPLVRVEMFPSLPKDVTVNLSKAFGLNVREEPSMSSKVVQKYPARKQVTVSEYALRGSSVWGRTDKGWIALCWYPSNGRPNYYTTWKMKTEPPVAPR